jgi:hypothetical protein
MTPGSDNLRAPADEVPAPGDRAGVAELFRASQATAEDGVQDVFTRVYARAERLTANGIAMPYFRTAVVNGWMQLAW